MTLLDKILLRYEKGQLNDLFLANLMIDMVDEDNIDTILSAAPPPVLERIRHFATVYEPGKMIVIGYGTEDPPERVECIRRWFAKRSSGTVRELGKDG